MSVLIVGGGPAGVTTGLLLARAGIDVRVVEREANFKRVFRGEGLMPSGIDALYQMGLGELLESLPTRVMESWRMFIDGRPIFTVPEPYEELGSRAMRIVPQVQFLERVVEEAARLPNFRFEFEQTFRDVIREDGRCVGATLESAGGQRQDVTTELIIGCDGRGSVVRARAGIHLQLIPQAFDVLWFKLPAPASLCDGCSMLLMATTTTVGACYTSWDGRLQYALMIPKGVKPPAETADLAEELCAPAPDWLAEHIRSVKDELEGPVRLKLVIGRCPEWSTPGLLLIGDAAHPMSPVRAQGINVALRDAIVTANQLVPVFARGATPETIDAAARSVQAEREPEIIRAQHLQYQDTRFWGTRWAPLFITIAKYIGPVMGRFDWAKNLWRNQQRDLWFGSREVTLNV